LNKSRRNAEALENHSLIRMAIAAMAAGAGQTGEIR